jgi:hypothetical protein
MKPIQVSQNNGDVDDKIKSQEAPSITGSSKSKRDRIGRWRPWLILLLIAIQLLSLWLLSHTQVGH